MSQSEESYPARPNGGMADLRSMLGLAEGWMNTLSDAATDTLEKGVQRLEQAQATAVERGKEVATATDDYVHDHPWRSIGIAVLVGVCVGLWLSRR